MASERSHPLTPSPDGPGPSARPALGDPVTGARRTTGTAMAEALAANGADLAFGIPGTHNLELYRGMAACGIRHVVTRHEQGAGYAADGYARVTGRPGLVVTTSGPGLMNAMAAMGTAYADSVPLLVISPGVPTGRERAGYGWLHEMKDQRAAADGAVARSVRPGTPAQAVEAIHETFARWAVERPRPVHIEVPLDVLEAGWDGEVPRPWRPPCPPAPSPRAVAEALGLLAGAASPVIVAGGGAAGAAAPLRRVAEAVGAPVVTTTAGKGVLDEDHPLAVGAFPGLPAARDLMREADVLLVVGSELGDAEVPEGLAPRGAVIRIDLDPAQSHKNVRATLPVHADAGEALTALAAGLAPSSAARRAGERRAAGVRARCLEQAAVHGGRWRAVQDALRDALPRDIVVVGDSSQVSYLGTTPFWRFPAPRAYLMPVGYSTLGYAVPAAIGARLADPARPVVALLGDGAFMFSAQELVTGAELGLPLPVVILDNHGFAEIRQNMLDRGIAPYAVDLARPDFAALAQAMGCHGVRAADAAEAAKQAAVALTADRPTVIVMEVGP
ncbi:acetolactate synthase-1/2/3 large subunit [Thermocatellispora tengchongensis]|uniref:Acetolactate synthase-1/2/3 large subunit n=1 Tax=Thermocatellispora tengchongensis TaxID=1073253 RepID=A0A840PE66_9ACTN|nr:5-guanidino-2-oxopentanoate decarboxylase [Thermocatellispora tengchongensis]MBB5135437.1 acetolactate synthase-1/2/3 large subunit [Thermocatellispora tengchongensis]